MESSKQLFHSIYEKYYPLLRVIADKNGIEKDDVEDIVQDTFIAYYTHYPLDLEPCQIRAVLGAIMKNRCIDYLRKRNRHPMMYYDPQRVEEVEMVRDKMIGQDALTTLIEKEKYDTVWAGLKAMRDDWAQVFILHFVHGKSMKEVAKILGTTDAACRTRITRGRKYLEEYLNQH